MVDPNEEAFRLRQMASNGYFTSSIAAQITAVLDDRDRLLAAAAAAPSRTEARLVALGADVAALSARLDAIEGDWSTRNAVAELVGWRNVISPIIVHLDNLHRTPAAAEPAPGSRGVLVWGERLDYGAGLRMEDGSLAGCAYTGGWAVDTRTPPGHGWTEWGDSPDLHSAAREIAHRLRAAGWTVPEYSDEVGP